MSIELKVELDQQTILSQPLDNVLSGVINIRIPAAFSGGVAKPMAVPMGNSMTPVSALSIGSVELSVVGKCLFDRSKISATHREFIICSPNAVVLPMPVYLPASYSEERPRYRLLNYIYRFSSNLGASDEENSADVSSIPPSYLGSAVKIIYYLLVNVIDAENKIIGSHKVSFTVLPGSQKICLPSSPIPCTIQGNFVSANDGITPALSWPINPKISADFQGNEDNNSLTELDQLSDVSCSENHVSEDEENELEGLEKLNMEEDTWIAGPKSLTLALKNEEHSHCGQVVLERSIYYLGENIFGMIDFSKAVIPCYRVMVSLERIEEISDNFSASRYPHPGSFKVVSTVHSYCYNSENFPFQFSIPDPRFSPSSLSVPNFYCPQCKNCCTVLFSLCNI